jgi:hypothetical protein
VSLCVFRAPLQCSSTQGEDNAINESLIEETKHWLEEYPDVLKIYNEALENGKQYSSKKLVGRY